MEMSDPPLVAGNGVIVSGLMDPSIAWGFAIRLCPISNTKSINTRFFIIPLIDFICFSYLDGSANTKPTSQRKIYEYTLTLEPGYGFILFEYGT